MDAPPQQQQEEPAAGARAVQARDAFTAGDAAQSKAVHDAVPAAPRAPRSGGAAEVHGGRAICGVQMSGYVKSIVFGGLDGSE